MEISSRADLVRA